MVHQPPTIALARVYDPPPPGKQYRVLVDRLWPRGIRRDALELDEWMKEIAPSNDLRKWFGHSESRWEEFQKRYRNELASRTDLVDKLLAIGTSGALLLLFAARNLECNNAVVLKRYLEDRFGQRKS